MHCLIQYFLKDFDEIAKVGLPDTKITNFQIMLLLFPFHRVGEGVRG